MTTLVPGGGVPSLELFGTVWCLYTDNTDFKIQLERAPEKDDGSGEVDLDEIEQIGSPIDGTRKRWMDVTVPDDGKTYFWRARHVRNGWLNGEPTPWQPAKPTEIPEEEEDWPDCGRFLPICDNLMGPDASELHRLDPVDAGGVIHEYENVNLRARGIESGDPIAFGYDARLILGEGSTCIEANGDQTMCRMVEGLIAEDLFDRTRIGEDWEELRGTWTINQAGGYVETDGSPNILRYVGVSGRQEMVTQVQMWMSEGTSGGLNPNSEVPHPYVAGKVLDDASCYLFGFDHGSFSSIINGMYRRDDDIALARICSTAGSPWATETWGDYKLHVRDGFQSGEGAAGTGHLGCSATDTTYDGQQGHPGLATLDYTSDVSEGVSRFRNFRAYKTRTVTIENVPSGWSAKFIRATNDFSGLGADTKTVNESGGQVQMTVGNDEYYPYRRIEIYDSTSGNGTLQGSMEPTTGVWGGDRYHWAGSSQLPTGSTNLNASVLIRSRFFDDADNEVGSFGSTGVETTDFSHDEFWGFVPDDATSVTARAWVSTQVGTVAGGEVRCVQMNRGTVPCECADPGDFRPVILFATESIVVNSCSSGSGVEMTADWDVEEWVTDDLYLVEVQYREDLADGTSQKLAVTSDLDPQAKTDTTTLTGFGASSGSDVSHDLYAVVILYEKGSGTSQALDSRQTRVTTVSYGSC